MTDQLYVFENGASRPMTEAEHADWVERTTAAEAHNSVAANVTRAKAELTATDWVENASVRAAKSVPRVSNTKELDAYRSALRLIVVTKPEKVTEWPEAPKAVWITE